MFNTLARLTRARRASREDVVVYPRRTHMRVQMRDFAPVHIPVAPLDDPERRVKLVEGLRKLAEEKLGTTGVRLVLPRHQYVIKRLRLPKAKPEYLDEMVRHQLDARLSVGVEGMYWDYQSEPATGEEADSLNVVAYAVPRETVDSWRAILEEAGFKLNRVGVQTDEALSRSRSDVADDELVLVDAGEFVELICLRQGVPLASGCCEKDPTERWNEDCLHQEWMRLGTTLPADFMPRRCVIEENAGPGLLEWVRATFVSDELILPDAETSAPFPAARPLDLLRPSRAPEEAGARRRRHVRIAATAALLLLVVGWACDLSLRELDDEITRLSQEVDANTQLLKSSERVAQTETRLSQAWQSRRDWNAMLDALSGPLKEEAHIRLASLRGERAADGDGFEIRLSGNAADQAAMPRLMSGIAGSTIPFSVSPLGLRPIRNAEQDGVQFEISLKSVGAEKPKPRSRANVE